MSIAAAAIAYRWEICIPFQAREPEQEEEEATAAAVLQQLLLISMYIYIYIRVLHVCVHFFVQ